MVGNPRLRRYVRERLAGQVITEHGVTAAGPTVPFTGRNRARRADRRWAQAWSPEQIAARLRGDFPDDPTMRISHEAIYTWIYALPKGELARQGILLRSGRSGRRPRGCTRAPGARIVGMRSIDDRPAEAAGRRVPGHWEGDRATRKSHV